MTHQLSMERASKAMPSFTRHAEVRRQQRSVPDFGVETLLSFGSRKPAGQGATKVAFDKKGWKRALTYFGPWAPSKLGQLRKLYLILGEDGEIVTTAFDRSAS